MGSYGFPSPYGVLFILIVYGWDGTRSEPELSFRLLTEYYSFLLLKDLAREVYYYGGFPSPYGVLFILIIWTTEGIYNVFCFRLLTEYYSFLLKILELTKIKS